MSKPNFEITDKESGQKYWISRSVVVLAMVFVEEEPNGPKEMFVKKPTGTCYAKYNNDYVKDRYVLVNKRGSVLPSYVGYWNMPCGYLDYDETLAEACTREVMEENGVYIDPSKWEVVLPISDNWRPGGAQAVSIRHKVVLTRAEYEEAVRLGIEKKNEFHGDSREVDGTELMLINEDNLNTRGWAFNHKELLIQYSGYGDETVRTEEKV